MQIEKHLFAAWFAQILGLLVWGLFDQAGQPVGRWWHLIVFIIIIIIIIIIISFSL